MALNYYEVVRERVGSHKIIQPASITLALTEEIFLAHLWTMMSLFVLIHLFTL